GLSAYLLEDGHLLRTGTLPKETRSFSVSGAGGRIQEVSWEDEPLWDFCFASERQRPHHDAIKLPNGNVLMIVAERKTAAEAMAAGRDPRTVKGHLIADGLIEIKPVGKSGGEIVWEWHAWDHLVQDRDPRAANYQVVPEHPELIDI